MRPDEAFGLIFLWDNVVGDAIAALFPLNGWPVVGAPVHGGLAPPLQRRVPAAIAAAAQLPPCRRSARAPLPAHPNQVANTRELQRAAWKAVAEAEGLPFPAMERPQLYDMRPERAAMDVSVCQAAAAPGCCCTCLPSLRRLAAQGRRVPA